jgi:hypothetical protein
MEIQYKDKVISGYPNVEIDFCFCDGTHKKLMLASENSMEFEDAVLKLAEKIKKDRLMPEYDQIKITGTPQPWGYFTIDKLLDIIQKLVEKK